MIRAVFFDLDDTLLSINLSPFASVYLLSQIRMLARIGRIPVANMAPAVAAAYMAVASPNRTDELTNYQLLCERLYEQTGIPIDDATIADALDAHDRIVTPRLQPIAMGRPRPGGRACIEAVQSLELKVVLATNPTFMPGCLQTRMKWADVDTVDFAHITYATNSTRTKPCARYYEETARAIGVELDECLMVGNDPVLDFSQPQRPLRVAYVGHGSPERAFWHGSIFELSQCIKDVIARIDNEQE